MECVDFTVTSRTEDLGLLVEFDIMESKVIDLRFDCRRITPWSRFRGGLPGSRSRAGFTGSRTLALLQLRT